MEYTIILEKEEEGGFSVTVAELPGLHTEGETIEEAMSNAKEAIRLHLEALREAKESPPKIIKKEIVV